MNYSWKKIYKISLWLSLIMTVYSCRATAQEYSYAHYEERDGLAGSTVYCMAEDKEGYMWFGTETGLCRFDGTHFIKYTSYNGLPGNQILKIFVDSKNRIWLVPFKKAVAYIWHGKIHNKFNDSILRNLPIKSELINIHEDRSGNILFQQGRHLTIMNVACKIFEVRPPNMDSARFQVAGLNDKGGFRFGKFEFDKISRLDIVQDPRGYIAGQPSLDTGYLYQFLGKQLVVLQKRVDLLTFIYLNAKFDITLPPGFISLSRLNDSCVTFNTSYNTLLFNMNRRAIVDSFLQGQIVNGVMEDSEGNYWFSTLGNGVFRMGSKDVANYYFREKKDNLAIFCVKEIDSTLYFGGDHFLLCKKNQGTGRVESIHIYNAFSRGRIVDMVKGYNHQIIIGSDGGPFWIADFKKATFLDSQRRSIKSFQVIDDSLILESSNLFTRTLTRKDLILRCLLYPARSTCSYRSTQGIYYIGSLDGLYIIEKNGRSWFPGEKDNILSNRVTAIQESEDGTIWLALDGGGLAGFKDGKVIAGITEKQGLTSNICRSLFVLPDAIWVGTDKGLNKVMKTESGYRITSYTASDGLSSDMINAIFVKGSDVYVGTSKGVTWFNDNKLSKSSLCLLRMTGITVSGKQWVGDTANFILAHQDNNVRFDFVGISYKSTGWIMYKYRLLGLDTTWKYTRETFLSYPSLPSGEYDFQLSAINKFGVWSVSRSIRFSISRLLWEKTWFRILLVLSVSCLVFLIFNLRVRRIRKKESGKAEMAIKIAELEQMALRSQMNPHFIFNCLNSIQQYVMFQDELGANEFITRFAFLIQQTLNFSTRSSISLEEEMSYITTYMELERKRFENKFKYEIMVTENVDRRRCLIPPMILQPYIENAIRHGIGHRQDKKGRILINMEMREGYLVCIVEDNGVGRKVAGSYKSANNIAYQSVGMSLVAKRIEMLNKSSNTPVVITITDMEDDNGAATGTRITIGFPLATVLQ